MANSSASIGTIDLHVHTNCSDGTLSPTEVVRLARDKGLRAIAITDHDTIDGNVEAILAGRNHHIEVLSGVEISTRWEDITFHLLGFGLQADTRTVRDAFVFLEECRRQRNPLIIDRLRAMGVAISMEEVEAEASGAVVGRPHFARVLLKKRVVASAQDAFDRYLGRGAAAYVDKRRLTPAEAFRLIREAGGVSVLAHPGLVEREFPGRLPALVHHLIPLGLDGIEAHYSSHTVEQTTTYLDLNRRLNLLTTGGSDFHQPGDLSGPQLGTGFGTLRVPYSCFEALKDRLRTH